MNQYYCDLGFWRASDEAEVAHHIRSQTRVSGEPDAPRRAGFVRSAFLRMLCMAGLAEQPVEARAAQREERPVRESCGCGGEGEEFEYREAVLDYGEWVLQCPECGYLDRMNWLSEEARPLVLGLARRRARLRLGREMRS
jgi:hypothetical protein